MFSREHSAQNRHLRASQHFGIFWGSSFYTPPHVLGMKPRALPKARQTPSSLQLLKQHSDHSIKVCF